MSQKPVSNEAEDNKQDSGSAENQGEQFVSKKAYEDVSRDMHKYKKTAKELEAAKNEYEAKLRQIEEEKLAEQERWKELYEKQKQETEELSIKATQKEQAYLNSVKKSALKQELGVKDAYLVHADLSKVEFNDDGTLNMDSVHEVANKFRSEHGELIPRSHRKEGPSDAPPSDSTVSQGKKLEELTGKEAYEMLKARGRAGAQAN